MESTNSMALFKDLCDHITQSEFQAAQMAFLEQHLDKFDETDENKLEYTEIHS